MKHERWRLKQRQRELRIGDLRDFQDAFDVENETLIKMASQLQHTGMIFSDDALLAVAVRLKARSRLARTGDQELRDLWNVFGAVEQAVMNGAISSSQRDAEIKKLGKASSAVQERVSDIVRELM